MRVLSDSSSRKSWMCFRQVFWLFQTAIAASPLWQRLTRKHSCGFVGYSQGPKLQGRVQHRPFTDFPFHTGAVSPGKPLAVTMT